LKVGVPTETAEGERRVALTPTGVKSLVERGFEVIVQSGAGQAAGFADAAYKESGATIGVRASDVFSTAEVILKVNEPSSDEVEKLQKGVVLISFLFPVTNLDTVRRLAERRVEAFAMDLIPRITRAQSMDALSSMSTIAGYKAALLAANALQKMFPMFMTAAGTYAPARVLVIGAGVAGLQAIATCKRLGAVVEAFDVRPAVKEQVESLGARFVEFAHQLDDTEDASGYAKEISQDTYAKELQLIGSRLAKNDVCITTALIPGKKAPVLITKETVKLMNPGSVIVDVAASNGGNCEATVPGKTVQVDGVTIIGPINLVSQAAFDASRMYCRNITEFLLNLAPEGKVAINLEDEIIRDTLVTHEGKAFHEPTRLKLEVAA
jgi:NAD(P) transhydrogenase subunit alpha